MTKAKSKGAVKAKVKTKTKTTTSAKAAAPSKVAVANKAVAKKDRAAPARSPAKSKVDWSGAIRQALQEKQAPKAWPGGGSEAWKAVNRKT